jgi:hypothetical protein
MYTWRMPIDTSTVSTSKMMTGIDVNKKPLRNYRDNSWKKTNLRLMDSKERETNLIPLKVKLVKHRLSTSNTLTQLLRTDQLTGLKNCKTNTRENSTISRDKLLSLLDTSRKSKDSSKSKMMPWLKSKFSTKRNVMK